MDRKFSYIVALLAFPPAAVSQYTSEQCEFEYECIEVAARLRKEPILRAPITSHYFSADEISQFANSQLTDFINLTPNISIVEAQNVGNQFISIRGLTQVRNGESPVAVVVDDVLQMDSRQFRQSLLNASSIEIVKGPQGALYGRNATGGAIIIETVNFNTPESSSMGLGFGKNDRTELNGSITKALSESNKIHLSFVSEQSDGLIKNTYLNEFADHSDERVFKSAWLSDVSERTQLTFRANYSEFEGGALNYIYQPALRDANGLFLAEGDFPFDFSNADANDVSREIVANNLGFNDRDITDLSFKLTHELNNAELMFVSSLMTLEEFASGDQFPYTASQSRSTLIGPVDGTQTQYVDVKAFSNEVRLSGRNDNTSWMFGAYLLNTDRFISTTTGLDNGRGILRIESSPRFSNIDNPTTSFFGDDNDNRAWSTYGNIVYDYSDSIEFGAALRFDKDTRKQSVSTFNTSGNAGELNKAAFSQLQPKVSIRYLPSENTNLYASWGKGFRSGQFNQNGVADVAQASGISGVRDIADKEVSTSTEVGFKGYFPSADLYLTANLFDSAVSGQQYFVFVGAVGAQILVNIDDVAIRGGELQLSKSFNDVFSFDMSYGKTHSEIDAYALNPSTIGNKAPYIPDSTFNFALNYRQTFSDWAELNVTADYEKRGKQFWSPENLTPRDDLELVNLRAKLDLMQYRLSFTLSATNIFDEIYNAEFVAGGFAHPAKPANWQVDMKYTF